MSCVSRRNGRASPREMSHDAEQSGAEGEQDDRGESLALGPQDLLEPAVRAANARLARAAVDLAGSSG